MDNWTTLKESNDSPVGVNGYLDNMQLLWKLQSLDPLMTNEQNNNNTSQSFNQSTSANLPDDDDELVDKLFRESFAMQEMQANSSSEQQQQQQSLTTQSQQNQSRSLEMLLSSPPPLSMMNNNNTIDLTTIDDDDIDNSAQTIGTKRPRSPIFISDQVKFPTYQQPSSPHTQQIVPQQQQQQQPLLPIQQPSVVSQQPQQQPPLQQLLSQQIMPQRTLQQEQPRPLPQQPLAKQQQQQQQFYSPQHTFTQHSTYTPLSQHIQPPNNPSPIMNNPLIHPNHIQNTNIIAQFPNPANRTMTPPNTGFPVSQPPSANVRPFISSMSIPPRPQLRVHLKKEIDSFDSLCFDESKDPMKSDLDIASLRRLTVATLRTLGVYLSYEELPTIDIDDPSPTDSQQVLPAAAMQLITTMVLGTSGDKDVSQTVGSQISNGDLVALQRMIVAGLRSKNIVIHTHLHEPTIHEAVPKIAAHPDDTLIDVSHVRYEPPHNVTRLFLRLYRYILNMLLSTPDCWPFIQPVPETAFVYHQEIKHPMDLFTIEESVWRGKYMKFAQFERDMQLIWRNARSFHRNAGTIPKHADNLEKLFTKIVIDIKKQISRKQQQQQQSVGAHDFKFDPMYTLPEESDFTYPPIDQVFSENSTVYTISAISPFEPKAKRAKGMTSEKQLYLQLNGPFFQAVERMKSDLEGNHLIVPRFYIAKNRTFMRQIRSQGVLAIFYNVKTTRSRNTMNVETDIILAYPASELFDIDQMNECTDELAPKGWIHLRPLRIMTGVSFEVNESIERDYFKRMFTTSKMAIDPHHSSTTKTLLRNIVRKILGLPEQKIEPGVKHETNLHRQMQQHMLRTKEEEAMETNEGSDDETLTPISAVEDDMDTKTEMSLHSNVQQLLGKKEIAHDVWQKLFNVCKSKGVAIRNMAVHGNINWSQPDSEGFFKRVYFFEDVVVQAFRQMTMYQRITEVACLMKLKNLPHMAQMREVLYNDNGDITGLSIERYQTTLKQHAHVHSHHRLSAYQKYDVIHQMLVCMKTIHEAGLAHRDLSEVNIMVNVLKGQYLEDGTEKVCLYLIDFGKAVFCEANDVREWFVDVPRAEWEYDGDVVPETKEELETWCESLPWVKAKPDHGYRMYRSIQTLPKTRSDTQVLPWLIHPQAEDMYSIGVMIWKLFTDTEPWRGILDTDLQGLRYVAEDDYRIQRALEGEVHGELSRQLLLKCLKTRPQDRETAYEILEWISQDSVRQGLIGEWKMYSSDSRGARRSRSNYTIDSSVVDEEEKRRPKKKVNTGGSNRPRGRPRKEAIQT